MSYFGKIGIYKHKKRTKKIRSSSHSPQARSFCDKTFTSSLLILLKRDGESDVFEQNSGMLVLYVSIVICAVRRRHVDLRSLIHTHQYGGVSLRLRPLGNTNRLIHCWYDAYS